MKNINFAVLLVCTLLLSPLHAQQQELSMVANIWPPYVDEALPDNGLAMKIVDTAFKRAGYKTKLRIEKWEKALSGSKLGVYDVVGAVWKTESRKQKLLYSEPYLNNNIVINLPLTEIAGSIESQNHITTSSPNFYDTLQHETRTG